jgi:hypothetical protein
MTVTNDILSGYANVIATAGLGTFSPSGVYQTTDLAIYFKVMPDTPDRCIVLNWIPLTDEVNIPLGRGMLQIAARGARNNPIDVDNILDPVFDLLQNRLGDSFGTTTIVQCLRLGSVPMGQDSLVRYERADKYDVDYAPAPTTLRPYSG